MDMAEGLAVRVAVVRAVQARLSRPAGGSDHATCAPGASGRQMVAFVLVDEQEVGTAGLAKVFRVVLLEAFFL